MQFFLSSLLCSGLIPVLGSEADALAISANIQARHLPYATLLDPVFTNSDSDEIRSYTRCGDSATWTGHYLAAESYRYAVTQSDDALQNINVALYGLNRLIDVTGTGLLARCTFPVDSPYAADIMSEEGAHSVYKGVIEGNPYFWIGETSRDQYSGLFFGLTAAHDLVKDQHVQDMVEYLATRSLNYLRQHLWIVVMPDGTPVTTFIGRADQQLSYLKLGRQVNGGAFSTAYKELSWTLAPETLIPIALESTEDHSSYFKFNLDTINFYGLLTSGDNWYVHSLYKSAYNILRDTTKGHQNAFFNMVDRAIDGANQKRDAETPQLLSAWLARPRRDVYVDLRGTYASCGREDRSCTVIPVEQRVNTDFLWQRSPFLLYGGGSGTIETAGIDYILPYWMARYYGIDSGN